MAVDYFIDIKDYPGESEDATHTNTIPVLSFSWGVTQPGTFGNGTGGTAGKASHANFSFTMQTCKATPKLMQAASSGDHIDQAVLYCRKSTGADGGQQDYMTWTMAPVIVSSYHSGGSSGAEIPVDSVSLDYGTVTIDYKTQADKGGSLTAAGHYGFDITKNAKM